MYCLEAASENLALFHIRGQKRSQSLDRFPQQSPKLQSQCSPPLQISKQWLQPSSSAKSVGDTGRFEEPSNWNKLVSISLLSRYHSILIAFFHDPTPVISFAVSYSAQ